MVTPKFPVQVTDTNAKPHRNANILIGAPTPPITLPQRKHDSEGERKALILLSGKRFENQSGFPGACQPERSGGAKDADRKTLLWVVIHLMGGVRAHSKKANFVSTNQ